MVGAEIVSLVHRPTVPDVLDFHEYARSFPLHVNEPVDHRPVAVLLLFLVVERAESRIPGRRVELCVVPSFRSDLHLHDVLLYVELDVESGVYRQFRQRQHILVG